MAISPTDLSKYNGQGLVTIVYDDGQNSNFDVALPLHLEFNMQASFAIIAERALNVEKHHDRYMSASQVAEASRLGVEISSHSFSHPKLTEVDDAKIEYELSESRRVMERLCLRNITTFCVPYSKSNDDVIRKIGKHYQIVRIKGNRFTQIVDDAMPAVVYSYGIDRNTAIGDVKDLLNKAAEKKTWVTLMMHGVVTDIQESQREYDVDAKFVRQIIEHIKAIGPEKLLPINLSDIQDVRLKIKAAGLKP